MTSCPKAVNVSSANIFCVGLSSDETGNRVGRKSEISRFTDKERSPSRWRAGSECADFFINFSTELHFHFQVKLIWIRLLSNLGLPEKEKERGSWYQSCLPKKGSSLTRKQDRAISSVAAAGDLGERSDSHHLIC